MSLRGVVPMLVTPFDPAGGLDLRSLDRLVGHVAGAGVDGLAALGLAGEGLALAADERALVAERVIAAAAGVPVVIAATADALADARGAAVHAAARGAAALMVGPPRRPGIAREELVAHYAAIAAAVAPTPVMVQDAPAFLGTALDTALIRELARACPNVRLAKPESVPAVDAIAELAGDVDVFSGQAGLHLLAAHDAGAVGVIPGCDLAEAFVAIEAALRAGERARAERLHAALLPLLVAQFQSLECLIASSKEVLVARGAIATAALRAGPRVGARARGVVLAAAAAASAALEHPVSLDSALPDL